MTEHTTSFQTAVRSQPGPNRLGDLAKRLFDLTIALLSLALLSPVFGLLVLLIRRDSPGPALYRGPRAGKAGKSFRILKFRTMYERPESYQGPRVTSQDDPRITPLGKWLRDTKLNELPQLWNVLKSEMSLVGPRPEDPDIVAGWPAEARQEILSLRPGVTSPASILYRNEEALLSPERVMGSYWDNVLPSKLRLDQLYVRNRSFWMDLDVLFWTAMLLLLRLGSYQPPEELLFLGPISRFVRQHLNWFVIDTIITFLAIGLAGAFWRTLGPLDVGWTNSILLALGFALIFSLTGATFGVHKIYWSRARAEDALDLLLSAGVATAIALLINWLWPGRPLYPPGMILMASALAFGGFVVARYRRRILQGFRAYRVRRRSGAAVAGERVLVVGGGYSGQFLAWLMNNHRYAGAFHLVGFVDDDLYKQGGRFQGVEVLGSRADIPQLVSAYDVGLLVFAIHNIRPEDREDLLEICAGTPAQLVMVPDIMGALHAIAALNKELNGNGNGEGAGPELLAAALSPAQVDAWLLQLDRDLAEGDVAAAQAQIQALRSLLREEDPSPSPREGRPRGSPLHKTGEG